MSKFKSLFAVKNKENIPSTEHAVQKLKQTEEMLEKKQEFLEKKIEIENATAKKHAKTNKRMAVQALKRRKRLEKQLSQIDGILSTLEFQREALESAGMNTEVLKNMNFAAKVLKSVHDQASTDDVYDIIDDIQEQTDLSREISEAICGVGSNQDIDDEQLNEELEAIKQELSNSNIEEISTEMERQPAVDLPRVPSGELPNGQNTLHDEDEMKAWAL